MASVCAGSLAMMDAGVPLTEAVAGVAMGMYKQGMASLLSVWRGCTVDLIDNC
jgi:polyribonucleotide nucleotidyltransferase